MAEVVGLVASIIQIAGAGAKLSSALYHFTTSAVRADQDIADIAGDVELTSNALESVGKVFETEDAKSLVSKKAIQDANNLIKRCEAVFKDISELVDKRRKLCKDGKKLSMMGKLSWPMKEQRVELHRRRLESLKNSLVLLLHVLQLAQGKARGQLENDALEREREKIRNLHQRQQDSLECLQALESKLSKVALDDEVTLQGSTPPSRVPTLELMLGAPPARAPAVVKADDGPNAKIVTIDISAPDSETSESDATATDDEDEHLSLEELAKAAKHVQKLLKRITILQRSFDSSHKSTVHKKKRVRKIYQRFCRKWESDIVVAEPIPSMAPESLRPISASPPPKADSIVDTFGCGYKADSSLDSPALQHLGYPPAEFSSQYSHRLSTSPPPFSVLPYSTYPNTNAVKHPMPPSSFAYTGRQTVSETAQEPPAKSRSSENDDTNKSIPELHVLSKSPREPISPHVPHTPAIFSRLSANSIIEYEPLRRFGRPVTAPDDKSRQSLESKFEAIVKKNTEVMRSQNRGANVAPASDIMKETVMPQDPSFALPLLPDVTPQEIQLFRQRLSGSQMSVSNAQLGRYILAQKMRVQHQLQHQVQTVPMSPGSELQQKPLLMVDFQQEFTNGSSARDFTLISDAALPSVSTGLPSEQWIEVRSSCSSDNGWVEIGHRNSYMQHISSANPLVQLPRHLSQHQAQIQELQAQGQAQQEVQAKPNNHVPVMTPLPEQVNNDPRISALLRETQQRAIAVVNSHQPLTEKIRISTMPADLDPQVPPPLPPPRRIEGLKADQDPGWQWGNTNSSKDTGFGGNQLATVKPDFSLYGASASDHQQARQPSPNHVFKACEFRPEHNPAQFIRSSNIEESRQLFHHRSQQLNSDNHALQDYQMQLMLLEQQNKKRLLMTRHELDSVSRHCSRGGEGIQGLPAVMSSRGKLPESSLGLEDQTENPKPGQMLEPLLKEGSVQPQPGPFAPNMPFDPNLASPGMSPQFHSQMSSEEINSGQAQADHGPLKHPLSPNFDVGFDLELGDTNGLENFDFDSFLQQDATDEFGAEQLWSGSKDLDLEDAETRNSRSNPVTNSAQDSNKDGAEAIKYIVNPPSLPISVSQGPTSSTIDSHSRGPYTRRQSSATAVPNVTLDSFRRVSYDINSSTNRLAPVSTEGMQGWKPRARKKCLTTELRNNVALVRMIDSCTNCRKRKEKCDSSTPCRGCLQHYKENPTLSPCRGRPWSNQSRDVADITLGESDIRPAATTYEGVCDETSSTSPARHDIPGKLNPLIPLAITSHDARFQLPECTVPQACFSSLMSPALNTQNPQYTHQHSRKTTPASSTGQSSIDMAILEYGSDPTYADRTRSQSRGRRRARSIFSLEMRQHDSRSLSRGRSRSRSIAEVAAIAGIGGLAALEAANRREHKKQKRIDKRVAESGLSDVNEDVQHRNIRAAQVDFANAAVAGLVTCRRSKSRHRGRSISRARDVDSLPTITGIGIGALAYAASQKSKTLTTVDKEHQRNFHSKRLRRTRKRSRSVAIGELGHDPKRSRIRSRSRSTSSASTLSDATQEEGDVRDIVDILLQQWTISVC